MKKFADFIVNKRYFILTTVLILAVVCGIFMTKVQINSDMTKYLPDDSSMKAGLELMDEEFPDAESDNTIRVMFQGMPETIKEQIQDNLAGIDYVDSVEYEANDKSYNKEDYTLYVIHTTYDFTSDEVATIEERIVTDYTDYYNMVYSVDDDSTPVLPAWILILAVLLLMVILFIMCASWLEPILFLSTIGIAVVINMGTNAIFSSVSEVTYSIAAILQLALSMDYSIILINRYRQELKLQEDKYSAMKNALIHAFSSIASSSITTIVGLLALVFMSFKIGEDLGIVLAKGVLISMLSIFTVLPSLILMFDKLIHKTAKKELHIPMDKIGAFSYRYRHAVTVLFVVLFIAATLLKGNTDIAYTLTDKNEIDKNFPKNNPIVMLYENANEEQVAELAERMETQEHVKSVTAYSNTLGKEYTSTELADILKDMDTDFEMNLDSSLLDIIYYDYYNQGIAGELSLSTFMSFLLEDVITNPSFADNLDSDTLDQVDKMRILSNREEITKARSSEELAELFEMDTNMIRKLLVYYYANQEGVPSGAMRMDAFVSFLINDVASKEDYADFFDEDTFVMLQMLSSYSDVNAINKQYTSNEMADVLDMQSDMAKQLYSLYFYSRDNSPKKMTLPTFVNFLADYVLLDPAYAASFDKTKTAEIRSLQAIINASMSGSIYSSTELSQFTGMDKELIDNLLASTGVTGMSLPQFVSFILNDIARSEAFAAYFDQNSLGQLGYVKSIIDISVSGSPLNSTELAKFMGMEDPAIVDQLFLAYYMRSGAADTKTLSTRQFVTYILTDIASNPKYSGSFDQDTLLQLKTLDQIMNAALSGKEFSASEMAELIDMDTEMVTMLYLLNQSEHGDTSSWTISIQQLIDFIVHDLANNPEFEDVFNRNNLETLTTMNEIVDAVLADKKYDSKEMTRVFRSMSDQMDQNTVALIYLFYDSKHRSNPSWTLSIDQLFDFLTTDIIHDDKFADYFNEDTRNDLDEMKQELDQGVHQLKGENHSRMILTTTLPEESEETYTFLSNLIKDSDNNFVGKYYLVGNSPMAYEMSQSFKLELNTITLLTAVAIFIVVALTFRSLMIPTILVLIIQGGVYATISIIGFQGYSIFYLALLIVQCILMGATIDYGILFTNYYKEKRGSMEPKEALIAAYNGSIHTILTSGLIMIIVTAILGYTFENPTVGQICQTISKGAFCATILIVFILPGILATFDKVINKKLIK